MGVVGFPIEWRGSNPELGACYTCILQRLLEIRLIVDSKYTLFQIKALKL